MKPKSKKDIRAKRIERVKAHQSVPRFSFLIPTYIGIDDIAGVMQLGRCIDSVFDQTMQSWEIVIVADGACPRAYEIWQSAVKRAQELYQTGHLVKYIEAPYVGRRGGHQSVNVGKSLCSGEFLTILNQDNVLRKYYVEKMYSAEHDVLLCCVQMNDMPGINLNGRSFTRGGIDRLNYSIRLQIAQSVRHLQHLDADYDFIIDCIEYRQQYQPVRVHWTESILAEHN